MQEQDKLFIRQSNTPQIWVDADSVPKAIREIICKGVIRTHTQCTFVANHPIPLIPSHFIKMLQVERGFDVADDWIAAHCQKKDLIITQDIPLAAEVLAKGAHAINTRGEPYSQETIRQKLNMRDFLETLRASGIQSGGAATFGEKDKRLFANAFDRWLATLKRT